MGEVIVKMPGSSPAERSVLTRHSAAQQVGQSAQLGFRSVNRFL